MEIPQCSEFHPLVRKSGREQQRRFHILSVNVDSKGRLLVERLFGTDEKHIYVISFHPPQC